MKILITGVSGFIGSCLAKQLLGISCVKHELLGVGHLNEQQVPIPVIHWQDAGNIDVIVHLAARNDTQSTDEAAMMEANYYWPVQMFEYYYSKGCRKFIWASSGAVADMLTPYARSKAAFEEWTKNWRNPCIGFRFSNVWSLRGEEDHKGNRMSMVAQIYNKIKDGRSVVLFTGNPTRDFVHVDDVTNCLVKAIDVDVGGVFNVGSGISVSFEAVVDYCNKLLGTEAIPEYVECPFASSYQYFTKMDISKTKETFNWEPRVYIS